MVACLSSFPSDLTRNQSYTVSRLFPYDRSFTSTFKFYFHIDIYIYVGRARCDFDFDSELMLGCFLID